MGDKGRNGIADRKHEKPPKGPHSPKGPKGPRAKMGTRGRVFMLKVCNSISAQVTHAEIAFHYRYFRK